ncbi:TonB-dependent receptor [Novosphingobium sp. Chol11]|uniref:TonB-dependent receptor domain-containing protein n=1 Tax=Novosphingobium sp. Chol11 TaxID=1385763 RepID=UPI0025D8AD18|nr:TonB-dependent receptor [Novosphingobium sp. Chol11]
MTARAIIRKAQIGRALIRAALLCALAAPGCSWAREDVRADSPFAGGDGAAAAHAWEQDPLGRALPLPTLATLPTLIPVLSLPALPSGAAPISAQVRQARWTAHVAFELNPEVDLYAAFATGYKASAVNLSRGSRPFGVDQAFFEAASLAGSNQSYSARFVRPEDTKVYEIGLRANWGRANFNLALFQQSITGSQSSLLVGSAFVLAQAGRETVRGAEIEASLRPARGWLVSTAVTYLDARYDSYAISAAGNLSGMRPAGIPALSATVGAAREWPLAGGGRLILRGNFHYESPTQIQQALPGVSGSQPSFGLASQALAAQDFAPGALVNLLVTSARGAAVMAPPAANAAPFRASVREVGASLTWAVRSGAEFTLWGRNIANDRYRVTLLDAAGQPATAWGYANQPRAFGATMRLRY